MMSSYLRLLAFALNIIGCNLTSKSPQKPMYTYVCLTESCSELLGHVQ